MNNIDGFVGSTRPRVVERLDLDAMPVGCITPLYLELVHDGLGRPVHVPLLVARGEKRGATFGITAAVHGNELNGIPVIHKLFRKLDVAQVRGTIVAVPVVNVPGYEMRTRSLPDGRDLNHIMPGRPDGNGAEVYAHRIIDRVVRHFDFLLDLHTASMGRVNSLYVRADLTNAVTAQMAYLLRPQIILHNPASDRTLRGTAMELGIPAVTLEIGNPQRFHPEFIKSSLVGVRSVLADVGMLPRRKVAEGPMPVLCHDSQWLYTDTGGLLDVFPKVTQVVEQDEVIARITDVFGAVTKEYRAPYAGVVIGRSVDPVAQTGARILHLGAIASPGTHNFHERQRRSPAQPSTEPPPEQRPRRKP